MVKVKDIDASAAGSLLQEKLIDRYGEAHRPTYQLRVGDCCPPTAHRPEAIKRQGAAFIAQTHMKIQQEIVHQNGNVLQRAFSRQEQDRHTFSTSPIVT